MERNDRSKADGGPPDLLTLIGRGCGMLAPLVSIGAITLAIFLTPSFAWAESALSDLGHSSAPAAWIFNSGLILGGLLAVPFAGWYASQSTNHVGQLTAVSTSATALALIGVGVFPEPLALHVLFALGFYALLTYTLVLDGSARALAGEVRAGITWVWIGIAHITGWVVWVYIGSVGEAVPEAFGALLFASWIVLSAWGGRSDDLSLLMTGQNRDSEEP